MTEKLNEILNNREAWYRKAEEILAEHNIEAEIDRSCICVNKDTVKVSLKELSYRADRSTLATLKKIPQWQQDTKIKREGPRPRYVSSHINIAVNPSETD